MNYQPSGWIQEALDLLDYKNKIKIAELPPAPVVETPAPVEADLRPAKLAWLRNLLHGAGPSDGSTEF
jgi:hypothetical protein